MNLKQLLIFVFFYINFALIAQKTENFNGYWSYEMVMPSTQQDSTKQNLVRDLYNDMYIHLKENGEYSSLILNRNEIGHWKYNKRKIKLTSSQGAIIEMKIINISSHELTIEFANEVFKLKKNESSPLSISKANSENLIIKTKKKKKKRKKRVKP
mgnify:CR=1 FL=1